jgi:DNA-binding MarR family transcriptional regulator
MILWPNARGTKKFSTGTVGTSAQFAKRWAFIVKLVDSLKCLETSDLPMPTLATKHGTESKGRSAAEIARNWQLESGLGFLIRLLESRYDLLYQTVTAQNEITPRQFGVLMALFQRGPLIPSVLAEHISCDRNTLSEMLKRMTARKLVAKRSNPDDRRSVQIHITGKGEAALLDVVPAAAELQELLLAPLRKEDRAHFIQCLLIVAKAPAHAEPLSRPLIK